MKQVSYPFRANTSPSDALEGLSSDKLLTTPVSLGHRPLNSMPRAGAQTG